MKKYILFLIIIPGIYFSQNKPQITNFVNYLYGNDYYFLEKKSKPILIKELDNDWDMEISKENREKYISELEKQNLNEIDWSDFAINKAILCINGIPIINEDNFPYE